MVCPTPKICGKLAQASAHLVLDYPPEAPRIPEKIDLKKHGYIL